jgi:outer membrane protein OmpA-like peptidoglycan-associated protein/ABC-type taurine transport system substrate-binding protein
MDERRAKGWLVAAAIWLVILVVLALAYRFLVHPRLSGRLQAATSSPSQYLEEMVVGVDSFSGYAILRSAAVRDELKARRIRLAFQDDKADYANRMEALRAGKTQMAVFTLDSLISAGARLGEFPGSIVWVIDETKGGDAIVAYQDAVGSLQALNDPATRLILTPGSPSEFLARVVLANFNIPSLSAKAFTPANGAAAVLAEFRRANRSSKSAFVLWEPYVSRALEEPGAHVLLDSSRVRGYIVDVLVVQRAFLRDKPQAVRALVEAYARAAHALNSQADGLVGLVQSDARDNATDALDDTQARKVVQGIHWKNTLENYSHFGLSEAGGRGGLPTLEDMIGNVIEVLIRTGALTADPLSGRHSSLFYDQILASMKADGFHPGTTWNALPGVESGARQEEVRGERELPTLTAEQWERLQPVGELRAAPIAFQRGSARLSLDGEREIGELARRLQAFPKFYVRVVGLARAEGDAEANRILARDRAQAAAQVLATQGIHAERIRIEADVQGVGAEAQAVTFVVGQLPY